MEKFPYSSSIALSCIFRCKEKERSRKCYALHSWRRHIKYFRYFGAIIGTEGNINLRPDFNLITSVRQVNSASETTSRSTVEVLPELNRFNSLRQKFGV